MLSRRDFLIASAAATAYPALGSQQPPIQATRSAGGMVCSDSEIASKIGAEVLRQGGNAVDAGIAVAFALAVTLPAAGNIGGGGFMVIRMADGETATIDYREMAPAAAHRNVYLGSAGNLIKDSSIVGYRAAGVPGTVAGMSLAREKFGTRPWRELVMPAVALAEEGFAVPRGLAGSLRGARGLLGRFPESARIFLRSNVIRSDNVINNDNGFYQVGETFRQPELGATLRRIAEQGPREFYEGKTAELIAADMKANDGLMTLDDLRGYKPKMRQPLVGKYRGHELITMPPPSSGGVAMLQMLQMLEHWDIGSLAKDGPDKYHLVVEAMRRAFADRSKWMGDPDFVDVPVKGLLEKAYCDALAKSIRMDVATPSASIQPGKPSNAKEPMETTHFSVVDAAGNTVSNTYTINGGYGCGATVKGAGFLLNNEMDDFAAKPGTPNLFGLIQGENNAVAPRKRPLSSMTPTIIAKDGKLRFVIGSPGGPTIINTVMQTAINLIDHRMDLQSAVSYTRVHQQWLPDEINHEPGGLPQATIEKLKAMGHTFAQRPGILGSMQAIALNGAGELVGANEPRSTDGRAVGVKG
jgi:gamma-glutamyltranspeptidase/glutathione hydrolase